ncbi:MAG: 16S rRNA processing protein RimM [Acidobacteria bacterium]|nr:MAG: 16S rRNA processing protein RimM [Acidobacteriota bacterium]
MTSEFITLARVLKTQGRHGEVAVEVHSDVPNRFRERMHLWSLAEDGSPRELEIEDLWPHKGQLILKFVGIDSISKAEELAGCELQVPGEQRAQLEPGWNYLSDLIGCAVFDGDRELGNIGEVRFGAGEAPLLVVKAGSKEYEIPYAEAYLQQVDLSHKQIRMSLPEGLLEVNAPLTAEEKLAQRAPLRTKTK